MNEITPTYYATNILVNETYTLVGEHFLMIPLDAVGILASNNTNPLQNRNTQQIGALLHVVSRESDVLVLEQEGEHIHNSPTYLGAILSADRSIVYWVNDTKPIPE